jgi:hypothetical protein
MKTFEAVRIHFQELYRKLFGGGKADVYLENPEDVLETGIEVVARPPGKQLQRISLLSGGEKTLTAVALLLAIFRARPSPFCILDEVDAALDESNVDRFTHLVREFLDQSQFVIITHNKRTMSIGDVLYGITMQEPGVSRKVSVKFNDVREGGYIAGDAVGEPDQAEGSEEEEESGPSIEAVHADLAPAESPPAGDPGAGAPPAVSVEIKAVLATAPDGGNGGGAVKEGAAKPTEDSKPPAVSPTASETPTITVDAVK